MDDQNTNLSDGELEEIKIRSKNAVRGPWISFIEGRDMLSGESFIRTSEDDIYLLGCQAADQDFIACARQDIPRLIAEVERLKIMLHDKSAK